MRWIDVAAADMRRPGTFSYIDSYARNTAPPTGRNAGGANSSQYTRASNTMGRYNGDDAFNASINPDFGAELAYLGTDRINSYYLGRSWGEIIPWNHIYCADPWGINHAAGWIDNTRSQWWDWQVWIKKKSTGEWIRVRNQNNWGGVPIWPNFRFEDYSKTWEDIRTESNGFISCRLKYDPNAPYVSEGAGYWPYHGFAGVSRLSDFGIAIADVADVVVSAKHSLVVHNPLVRDDRDYARFAVAIGADWYATPRTDGNLGCGTSRHKLATAKWPAFEYVTYHTAIETSIRASYPSVFLNAYDNIGDNPVDPPPPEPPGPAPTAGNWFAVLSSSVGNWQSASAPSGNFAPVWSTAPKLSPVVNVAFSFQAAVDSASPAPTYAKTSGPSWASVSSAGLVTGTPTAIGPAEPLVITATNSAGSSAAAFDVEVIAAAVAPTITTTTLPPAVTNVAYNQVIIVTGSDPITLTLHAGTLPAGLSLIGRSIVGTPTNAAQAGSISITLRATNAAGTDDQAYTLLYSATAQTPAVTTATLASGTVGAAYSQALAATGAATIAWSHTGNLPPGLSRSGATISGTPTAAGTYQITVTATNSYGSASRVLTIAIASAAVVQKLASPWARWLRR